MDEVGSGNDPPTTRRGFWLHFGGPNQLNIMILRHRFSDAFLVYIVHGFERRLDLILEGFGMPSDAQNGKGGNLKNLCFH